MTEHQTEARPAAGTGGENILRGDLITSLFPLSPRESRDAKPSFGHPPAGDRGESPAAVLRQRRRPCAGALLSLESRSFLPWGSRGGPRPAERRCGRPGLSRPAGPLARRPPRGPGTAQDANRISQRCPWVKGCAGTFLPSEVACLSSAKIKLGWATQGTRYWEQLSFSGSPLHPLSLQQASWEKPFPITPSHLQEHLVVPPRFVRHSWVVHIVGIGRPQRESKRNAVRFNCFLFI